MITVKKVSELTGVSIRTLHYYDKIGLLRPAGTTQAGYRLYDDTALERLQQILLFRELEFPLKEIMAILGSPDFNRQKALDQQIGLLRLKKEHLENLIDLALGIKLTGVKKLDFKAFDTRKINEYARQAKASWGRTDAYREYEKKTAGYTKEDWEAASRELMSVFTGFGGMKDLAPDSEAAQKQVGLLQAVITKYFYTCTPEILSSLGCMYAGGGSMSDNIDAAGGEGTAAFAEAAIRIYCKPHQE